MGSVNLYIMVLMINTGTKEYFYCRNEEVYYGQQFQVNLFLEAWLKLSLRKREAIENSGLEVVI